MEKGWIGVPLFHKAIPTSPVLAVVIFASGTAGFRNQKNSPWGNDHPHGWFLHVSLVRIGENFARLQHA